MSDKVIACFDDVENHTYHYVLSIKFISRENDDSDVLCIEEISLVENIIRIPWRFCLRENVYFIFVSNVRLTLGMM